MSNTMTAAHEPTIHYLDSILNEEEKRCDQYSHQWRNFTISRSGRFRSKNKKRDVVDGKLFDNSGKENDKISARNTTSAMSKTSSYTTNTTTGGGASTATGTSSVRSQRDKTESYKSFYETNL